MIRLFFVFAIIYTVYFFGITWLKHLNAEEGWSLVKIVLYSLLCTALTVFTLIGIVIIF